MADRTPYEQQAKELCQCFACLNTGICRRGERIAAAMFAVAQERDAKHLGMLARWEGKRLEAQVAATWEALSETPCPRADFPSDTCDFWAERYGQERCKRCAALSSTRATAEAHDARVAQEAAETWAAHIEREGCNDRGCYRDEHTMQCPVGIAAYLRSRDGKEEKRDG